MAVVLRNVLRNHTNETSKYQLVSCQAPAQFLGVAYTTMAECGTMLNKSKIKYVGLPITPMNHNRETFIQVSIESRSRSNTRTSRRVGGPKCLCKHLI